MDPNFPGKKNDGITGREHAESKVRGQFPKLPTRRMQKRGQLTMRGQLPRININSDERFFDSTPNFKQAPPTSKPWACKQKHASGENAGGFSGFPPETIFKQTFPFLLGKCNFWGGLCAVLWCDECS